MVLYNLGSVANSVYNRVDGIPTSISGAELLSLIYEQVLFMQEYTGLNIGSINIAERFQPALLALSCGAVQKFIESQGADKSYSIGEFSVSSKGSSEGMSNAFTADGMEKLKRIGRRNLVYRAYG